MKSIAENTINRLIVYKKELGRLLKDSVSNVYSHKLAQLSGFPSHLVRRDLMNVGYYGSPAHGYKVNELEKCISDFLCTPDYVRVILIGVGNLGRAILDYCNQQNPKISIIAAFDSDKNKVNKIYHGIYTFHIGSVQNYIKENDIKVAIITVPGSEAQKIASEIVESGVNGIVNFTPVRLQLPDDVYIENLDMMLGLEKVVYFVDGG
ncbi:MAG: redox-sensing transcriptional repressor Rex [Ignavibacteriae bacterium]|nr:redox-sensing transcriptional repressor Rex [Ignavibacteriota bacterium]